MARTKRSRPDSDGTYLRPFSFSPQGPRRKLSCSLCHISLALNLYKKSTVFTQARFCLHPGWESGAYPGSRLLFCPILLKKPPCKYCSLFLPQAGSISLRTANPQIDKFNRFFPVDSLTIPHIFQIVKRKLCIFLFCTAPPYKKL